MQTALTPDAIVVRTWGLWGSYTRQIPLEEVTSVELDGWVHLPSDRGGLLPGSALRLFLKDGETWLDVKGPGLWKSTIEGLIEQEARPHALPANTYAAPPADAPSRRNRSRDKTTFRFEKRY